MQEWYSMKVENSGKAEKTIQRLCKGQIKMEQNKPCVTTNLCGISVRANCGWKIQNALCT